MPFLISLILGGILAMALAPFVNFLERRGLSRNMSLILFSITITLIGLVPMVGFFVRGSRIISQAMHDSNFKELTTKFMFSTQKIIEKFCAIYDLDSTYVETKFNNFLTALGNSLSNTFNNFVTELPLFFMMALITSLTLYFSLKESHRLRTIFNRYFYFSKKNGDNFIDVCKICCREVFFSSIITGFFQSLIVCVGALIFNIGDFFLIFVSTYVPSIKII